MEEKKTSKWEIMPDDPSITGCTITVDSVIKAMEEDYKQSNEATYQKAKKKWDKQPGIDFLKDFHALLGVYINTDDFVALIFMAEEIRGRIRYISERKVIN